MFSFPFSLKKNTNNNYRLLKPKCKTILSKHFFCSTAFLKQYFICMNTNLSLLLLILQRNCIWEWTLLFFSAANMKWRHDQRFLLKVMVTDSYHLFSRKAFMQAEPCPSFSYFCLGVDHNSCKILTWDDVFYLYVCISNMCTYENHRNVMQGFL